MTICSRSVRYFPWPQGILTDNMASYSTALSSWKWSFGSLILSAFLGKFFFVYVPVTLMTCSLSLLNVQAKSVCGTQLHETVKYAKKINMVSSHCKIFSWDIEFFKSLSTGTKRYIHFWTTCFDPFLVRSNESKHVVQKCVYHFVPVDSDFTAN